MIDNVKRLKVKEMAIAIRTSKEEYKFSKKQKLITLFTGKTRINQGRLGFLVI